jgi:malate synthase
MDSLYNGRPISPSVTLRGGLKPGYDKVLTPESLGFVADLAQGFTDRIEELLVLRRVVQSRYDVGLHPRFRPETRHIRESEWRCAPVPEELLCRRVELIGPVSRKRVIEGLNSGADVFMADFEDGTSPTWDNMIRGQINLYDAARREIRFEDPVSGCVHEVSESPATLFVRPRGLHLWESHVEVAGRAVPAGLFDFGLFLFHNASELLARGTAPYFYLPKIQSRLEARLWNEVFVAAQTALGIPVGTIKATLLIETLPAAFEMDEILFELRDHSAGLNCGRWDYLFSYIKTFREHTNRIMPDRSLLGMEQPFVAAYRKLVVQTCHRRGVHAIGGMAAEIPIEESAEDNQAALKRARQDTMRGVLLGHDGTWVGHPALVPVAMEVFDEQLSGPNQLGRTLRGEVVSEADLLAHPVGRRTEEGLLQNVRVGLRYLTAWLSGEGCVSIDHLMEDAATAEIARSQLWQWIHHGVQLEGGRVVTSSWVQTLIDEELVRLEGELEENGERGDKGAPAALLFGQLVSDRHFHEFLTLPGYEQLRTDYR